MTSPGYTTDLITGLALHLDQAGVATWQPDGAYPASATAITVASMPATPDRVVCLTAYALGNDPTLNDATTGVQIRCRGQAADPRAVDELADAVFRAVHGLTNRRWGTAYVVLAARQSSVSLSQDDNRRWERADTYYVTAADLAAGRIE